MIFKRNAKVSEPTQPKDISTPFSQSVRFDEWANPANCRIMTLADPTNEDAIFIDLRDGDMLVLKSTWPYTEAEKAKIQNTIISNFPKVGPILFLSRDTELVIMREKGTE